VHVAITDSEHELISANPANPGFEPGNTVHLQVRRALWFGADEQRIFA
jgi:hypothetical protein